MTYEFHCQECGEDFEVTAPMNEGPGIAVCKTCNIFAHRIYSLSFQVPDHMRAAGDPVHERVVQRMKHAPSPSGKGKINY